MGGTHSRARHCSGPLRPPGRIGPAGRNTLPQNEQTLLEQDARVVWRRPGRWSGGISRQALCEIGPLENRKMGQEKAQNQRETLEKEIEKARGKEISKTDRMRKLHARSLTGRASVWPGPARSRRRKGNARKTHGDQRKNMDDRGFGWCFAKRAVDFQAEKPMRSAKTSRVRTGMSRERRFSAGKLGEKAAKWRGKPPKTRIMRDRVGFPGSKSKHFGGKKANFGREKCNRGMDDGLPEYFNKPGLGTLNR